MFTSEGNREALLEVNPGDDKRGGANPLPTCTEAWLCFCVCMYACIYSYLCMSFACTYNYLSMSICPPASQWSGVSLLIHPYVSIRRSLSPVRL